MLNFYLNVEQFRTTLGGRCIVLMSQVQMLNKLQKKSDIIIMCPRLLPLLCFEIQQKNSRQHDAGCGVTHSIH